MRSASYQMPKNRRELDIIIAQVKAEAWANAADAASFAARTGSDPVADVERLARIKKAEAKEPRRYYIASDPAPEKGSDNA